ncbi:hypothetical protein FCY10_20565, partial [Escherichia coli]|nr:hypothetical protein [Escherichia coli]
LLCHGMVCVVGRMRDLILQLSKSSIYSTKPMFSSNDDIIILTTEEECHKTPDIEQTLKL